MGSLGTEAPPITVEQYEGFQGYPGLRDELICGEIVLSPQPKPLHQQVAKNIERLLDKCLQGGLFVAQRDSNIKFFASHSMPAPDVFVVRRDEWKQACESDKYLESPPSLVVEVLSPANRKRRVEQKVDLYLEGGVPCVWVVDPKRQRFFSHTFREAETELDSAGTVALLEPLHGTVHLADIFLLE